MGSQRFHRWAEPTPTPAFASERKTTRKVAPWVEREAQERRTASIERVDAHARNASDEHDVGRALRTGHASGTAPRR